MNFVVSKIFLSTIVLSLVMTSFFFAETISAQERSASTSPTILMSDDFSGPLSKNWTIGSNSAQNPGGPKVSTSDGNIVFTQLFDYVETKMSFSGDFVITFDAWRVAGSNQCSDFYIELVSSDGPAAIQRFRYGNDAKDSINLGKAPEKDKLRSWDCIRDGKYLRELDHVGQSEGKMKFEHKDSEVQFSFTNDQGRTISTPWVAIKPFKETKVRIWGSGSGGGPRYVDNFVISTEAIVMPYDPDATHAHTDDEEDEILLEDDFSGSLSTNWDTGTNNIQNKKGPNVSIIDGRVAFSQRYDYIQTKQEFEGNFEIRFDAMRITGSNQCADFYIELVSSDGPAAIQRFRYGSDAKDSINLGKPPEENKVGTWDCIRAGNYLRELDHIGNCEGTLILVYKNGSVQFSFINSEGQTISTQWVPTTQFDSTKVRIWGLGGSGSQRYLDNVVISRVK